MKQKRHQHINICNDRWLAPSRVLPTKRGTFRGRKTNSETGSYYLGSTWDQFLHTSMDFQASLLFHLIHISLLFTALYFSPIFILNDQFQHIEISWNDGATRSFPRMIWRENGTEWNTLNVDVRVPLMDTLPAFERPEVWPVGTTSWLSVGNRPCDVVSAEIVVVVVVVVRAVWADCSIE